MVGLDHAGGASMMMGGWAQELGVVRLWPLFGVPSKNTI